MADFFDDLIPASNPSPTGFDDLIPQSQFSNVQSGAASAAVPEKGFLTRAAESIAEIPEGLYEGTQAGLSNMGGWLSRAATTPAIAFDAAKSAVTGELTTDAQDWMFGNLVDPFKKNEEAYQAELKQKGLPAKIAGGVGQALPDVALAVASGGAAAAGKPLVESGARTLAKMIAESAGMGIKTAAPLAEKAAGERYAQAIAEGKSIGEATGEAIKAIGTTTAMGLTGSGGVGRLGNTIASGLSGEAIREMEGRPFDPAELGTNLALGFGLSGPKQEALQARELSPADRELAVSGGYLRLPAPVVEVNSVGEARTSASTMQEILAAQLAAQDARELGITPGTRRAISRHENDRIALAESVADQRSDDSPPWWVAGLAAAEAEGFPPQEPPVVPGRSEYGLFSDLVPESTERPLEAPTNATEDTGATGVAGETNAPQNATQSVLDGTTDTPELSPTALRIKEANEQSLRETGKPISADQIRAIREEAVAQDETLDLTPEELQAYQQWQRGQEETPEVSIDDLSPADRALVERSTGADDAVSFLREESARLGESDAEQSGLRTAVKNTLGDAEVTFLRDEDGLPSTVKTKPKADGTVRKGLYDPATGKVYLFTGSGMTPQDAAFTAAHEIAGHKGLRSLAASEAKIGTKSAREWLDTSLSNALQNPTVKAVADSMAAQRKSGDTTLMAEEAMADLAAAVRTGDWKKIEDKHGVVVPEGVRAGVKGVVQKFIERIRRLVNVTISKATGKQAKFTDAQVNELIENAWKAVSSGEQPQRSSEAPLEQRVFHGTPHRGIEQEGFKLNKIGTGEGAQAYGWGLYFAKQRDIAEYYRNALSGADGTVAYGPVAQMQARADAEPGRYRVVPDDGPLGAGNAYLVRRKGQLYHAEVPEDSDLLDWDKPLSEQPEKVRAALRRSIANLKIEGESFWERDLQALDAFAGGNKKVFTGADLYADIIEALGSRDSRSASEYLNSIGIPGLRYLDGTSRNQKGEGSHNYVIWDEGAVRDVEALYSDEPSQPTKRSNATPEEKVTPEVFRKLSSILSWKGGNKFANEFERAKLEAATGDFLAQRSAALFDKAGFKSLSDNQKEVVRAALNGDKAAEASLSPKVREAVRFTRDEITNYQSQLAGMGVKMDGRDLSDMLYDSMAKDDYTTRAYGVYEIKPTSLEEIRYALSPDARSGKPFWRWRQEKHNPEAVRNLTKFIEENLIDPNSNRTPQEQVEDLLNQLADPKGFSGSNVEVVRQAARDSSILKARENVPKPIREYWGEFKDPRLQAAYTLSRLGALTAKQGLLTRLAKEGDGKHFFEEGSQPKGYTAKLPENSDYGPLAGKMTRPDIARQLESQVGIEKSTPLHVERQVLTGLFDHYANLSAKAKVAKTVLSFATGAVNAMANVSLVAKVSVQHALMGQFLGIPDFAKASSAVAKDFLGNLDTETGKMLISKGIIRDSAQYGELRKVRSRIEREAAREGSGKVAGAASKVADAGANVFQKIADLYQTPDNFSRAMFFFGEMTIQKKLHPDWTEQKVIEYAANKARDEVPTWGRASPTVKATSRAMGNFATWSGEVIRSYKNQVKNAVTDMVHGETPAQKYYGFSQLAATSTSIALAQTLVPAVISSMFGLDTDDKKKNEAVSKLAPEYFGGDTLSVADSDPKSGKIVFLNATRLDPSAPFHQLWNREMTAIKDDASIPEATWGWIKDSFLTPGPAPQAVGTAVTGKDKFDRKLAPDERAKAVVDAFKPGSAVTLEKIAKLKKRGVDQRVIDATKVGLPLYELDTARAMTYATMDFSESIKDYRAQFNRGYGAAEATPEDQKAKYVEFLKNEKEAFDKIHRQVKALQTIFGEKEGKTIAMDAFKEAKLDKDYVRAIEKGTFVPNPIDEAKTFLDRQEQNAIYNEPSREKEIRKDFAERRRQLAIYRRNYQSLLKQ